MRSDEELKRDAGRAEGRRRERRSDRAFKVGAYVDASQAAELAATEHERDNGRRGEPLPGCDCLRCFGRCSIARNVSIREVAERRRHAAPGLGLDNYPQD